MLPDWFAFPDGAFTQEGVGLQDHEGGKGGEHVVGDLQLHSHRLILRLLHINDELDDARVGLPQFVGAEDEFHARRPVEASSILIKVVKDCADRDTGAEGSGDAHLLDPHQFDVGQDEVARPYLDGADGALVSRPCLPDVLKAAHH